jgi:signal transduction histidine kinase
MAVLAGAVVVALVPTVISVVGDSVTVLASLAAQVALVLAGVLLWPDREHRRHAVLLLCASASVGLSNLNSGSFEYGYWLEVGWLATWAAAGFLVPVLLEYPASRPADRALRWLTALTFLWAIGLRTVLALTWDPSFNGYEGPAEWLALYPSVTLNRAVEFASLALLGVLLVWFSARCARRWRTAHGPVRGTVRLVAGAGLLLALGLALRSLAPYAVRFGLMDTGSERALEVVHNALLAAVPLALLAVAARAAARRSAILERMLGAAGDPPAVEAVLQHELDDPTLRLRFAVDGRWVGTDGLPAEPDREAPAGRLLRDLATGDGGAPAVVDADAGALLDPALLRIVLAAASVVLANTRLTVERSAHLAELSASRARIVEAGVAQRRQLERDLHDGAQQHLLTVATTLSRAGMVNEQAEVQRALDDAREQLSTAMAELRRLARGIHPAALSQGGLAAGLESLAALVDDVTVELGPGLSQGQRLDPAVEATAYFVVTEGVANAQKHAGTPVRVVVDCDTSELTASIADQGPGGARVGSVGGLRGLTDRTHALGGTLVIDSPAGAGTRVLLRLPLRSRGAP